MSGLAEWLREKAKGSLALGEVIALADAAPAEWPSHREDPAPYVEFINAKVAPPADRDRLIAALLASYAEWKQPKRGLTGIHVLAGGAGLVAVAILWGIFSGFLGALAREEYARGLITFLFATCTISVILIVVVSVFWMNTDEIEKRFTPAKDIITILIGVLGTIIGFYFGTADNASGVLTLGDFGAAEEYVMPGDTATITGTLVGGTAPYHYSIAFEGDAPLPKGVQNVASDDGKVDSPIEVPVGTVAPTVLHFTLTGQDSTGRQITAPGRIFVAPAAADAEPGPEPPAAADETPPVTPEPSPAP